MLDKSTVTQNRSGSMLQSGGDTLCCGNKRFQKLSDSTHKTLVLNQITCPTWVSSRPGFSPSEIQNGDAHRGFTILHHTIWNTRTVWFLKQEVMNGHGTPTLVYFSLEKSYTAFTAYGTHLVTQPSTLQEQGNVERLGISISRICLPHRTSQWITSKRNKTL